MRDWLGREVIGSGRAGGLGRRVRQAADFRGINRIPLNVKLREPGRESGIQTRFPELETEFGFLTRMAFRT